MNLIHGMSHTRFYKIWIKIKNRVTNSNYEHFNRYGGRGIKVCNNWLKFENFRDDMYESYLKHVKEFGEKNTLIERISNNGNYELNNCKWATQKEQVRNRSNTKKINYKGKNLALAELAEEYHINYKTFLSRLNRGWSLNKSLTTKILKNVAKYLWD